jgi:hypothetical protein
MVARAGGTMKATVGNRGMNQPWRVVLLGGLRVERGEQQPMMAQAAVITRFKSHKVGGLLAFLAFHRRQVHSREVLIEIFWPDSPPEQGATACRPPSPRCATRWSRQEHPPAP